MNDVTFQVGQEDGRRFGDSLISQLENIAASRGVPLSGIGGGAGGSGGTGTGSRYQRAGGGAGRSGRTSSRSLGGGGTYHAAEKPYRGEPILGEDKPQTEKPFQTTPEEAGRIGDAQKALREGLKGAQDTEARVQHGAGTPDQGTQDAARDPGAAKESDRSAAARDPNLAAATLAVQAGGVDRSVFTPELAKHQELVRRAAAMVAGEIYPEKATDRAKLTQLETAFNRAQMRGHSLEQALWDTAHHGQAGYYPLKTFTHGEAFLQSHPDWYKDFQNNIWNKTLAGSDEARGFTGNASADVAARQKARGTPYLDLRGEGGDQYFLERSGRDVMRDLPRLPGGQPERPRPQFNPESGRFEDDVFPSSGHITSAMGNRANAMGGGGQEFHPGTDIGTGGVSGGEVRTPHGGKVVRVGKFGGYGNSVDIQREDGTLERYGHLQEIPKLKVGQQLERGEVFGRVGSTGRSTGPHLHYERRDAKGNVMNSTEELGVKRGQEIEGGAPIHPDQERSGRPQMPLSDPQEGPFKLPLKKQSEADQVPFKVAGREQPPSESEESYAPGRAYNTTAPINPQARMRGQEKGDFKPADKPPPRREDSDEDFTPAHVNPTAKKEEPKPAPKKEDTKEG